MKSRTVSIWTKAPFARIAFLVILGIGFAQLFPDGKKYWILAAVGCLSLLLSRVGRLRNAYSLRHWSGTLNASALVLLMATYVSSQKSTVASIHDPEDSFYAIDCLSAPSETSKNWKIEGQIESASHCGSKVLIYFKKPCKPPTVGDMAIVQCKFSSPDSCEFLEQGYIDFLKQKEIAGLAFGASAVYSIASRKGLTFYSENIRSYLVSELEKHNIKGDALAIICAMTLGTKEHLDDDLRQSYASSGAIHILAVSGLHVGIVYLLLSRLLRSMLRRNRFKLYTLAFILIVLWIYAFLTGLSPSVLRACTMFSFLAIGRISERPTNIYNTLAASAVFLLILEPKLLFSLSFQLSYLAVFGIVYLQPRIFRWIYVQNRILRWFWEITAASLAAQIATFPMSLHYFGQFPNYFILTNWIAIPLATSILVLGLSFFLFHWTPWISDGIAWQLKSLTDLLNWGIRGIESLPGSLTQGINCSFEASIFIYITLGVLLMWLETKKAIHLKRLFILCIVGVLVSS